LHIHNEIFWGWNSTLNTKFTYVSYIPYTHRLEVILYNILNNLEHEAKFPSIEFSTCGVMSALAQSLRCWSILDFDFQIVDAYPEVLPGDSG
jgi:hypothetical protein